MRGWKEFSKAATSRPGRGLWRKKVDRVQLGETDEWQGKQPQQMVKSKVPAVGLTRE